MSSISAISTTPGTTISNTSSPASVKKDLEHDGPRKGRKAGNTAPTTTITTTYWSSNGHATRKNTNSNNNNHSSSSSSSSSGSIDNSTLNAGTEEPISTAVKSSEQEEPSRKRPKTGTGMSEAIKPSPLRSSITTIRSKSSKLAKYETETGTDDIESVDVMEDKDVSELSNADARAPTEANIEDNVDTLDTSTKRTPGSAGSTARQKKQNKAAATTSSGGGGTTSQAGTATDPPAAKLASTFVIDKNLRARNWHRPSTVEMLLNEPRPYFIQRSYPMPTISSNMGPASATATSLARMAVLNQMDTNYGYDTPERCTTPESGESSPVPPSSPLMKKRKKHAFRKQSSLDSPGLYDLDSIMATTPSASIAPLVTRHTFKAGTKRKRVSHSTSAVTPTGDRDDEAGDSSARSTPAPTSRPRPIPTRPRMYPCSFEGCTKSFMDKFHLKRHETRHVTQMITCGINECTKAYDSISTMRRHQSMMHKEWKQGMAATSDAAASSTSGVSATNVSDAHNEKEARSKSMISNEEDGNEDDVQSEKSGTSPSSVNYSVAYSPMRD
ncbi:hypothetical protein BGZ65_001639 [Modicella reniformis]|uniref:C2H2-type domain-containing protein n=1 Tax=Modicella reniformis TaxID=1440133 RepID=A0A9P6LT45_9FUNG|nr:hypothetical protein BGZ65_001639 [Modicella reniformis]